MDKKANKKWERPDFPKGVSVLAIQEQLKDEPLHWHIYIFNETDNDLATVLVTASGYGEVNGEDVKTSSMRYNVGDLSSYTAKRIEPISTEVMGLYNQYWVSFTLGGKLYDRKFTFPPSHISVQKSEEVKVLGAKAVFAN